MAFVERRIDVSVSLAQASGTNQPNVFADGANLATFSGHRTSVRIQNSGALAGSAAQVAVWGLTPAVMNQLSTLGMVIQAIPRNTITVSAGDAISGVSKVFVGTIIQAYGDFNDQPNTPFRFECQAAAAEAVASMAPSSYTGATDVVSILQKIASAANWGFENNGVSVNLSSPYLWGSAWQQVRKVADAAHINVSLLNNVLCVWPLYGARVGTVPVIAPPPAGEMIGYPSYTQAGIMVNSVFNPNLRFGGQMQVISSLPRATGLWNVNKLDLALDAVLPKGQWMSTAYGYNPQFPAPLPPQT